MRNVKAALEKSQNLGKPISPEVMVIANNMEEPGRLADLTASNLDLKVEGAQAILEALDPVERLRRVHELMTKELEVLTMQQEISSQAKGEMDRIQREFFLRQQLKAIQSELGEGNELAEEIVQLTGEGPEGEDAEAGHGGGGAPAQEARAHAPRRGGDGDAAQLARLDGDPALEQVDEGQPGPQGGPADPRRGPLRPREGQGADRRVPGGAQAQGQDEGAAPVLRGPPRRGQDQPRPVHRPRPGPQVRPAVAGRRQGRGRDPRPPAHLRRLDAGPHHPGHPPGRRQQPGLHDGRGGQDRRRLPRRPLLGAARGARPRAEQLLPRPLPRRAVRPVERDVHHHRQPHRHDPARLPRPHGGDPPPRLHRGREARDRQAPPGAQAARGARAEGRAAHLHGQGAAGHDQLLHAGGGPAEPRARDRGHLPQGRAQGRRGREGEGPGHARRRSASTSEPRRRSRRSGSRRTRSGSPPGSPGPRPAATSSSSRRRP